MDAWDEADGVLRFRMRSDETRIGVGVGGAAAAAVGLLVLAVFGGEVAQVVGGLGLILGGCAVISALVMGGWRP